MAYDDQMGGEEEIESTRTPLITARDAKSLDVVAGAATALDDNSVVNTICKLKIDTEALTRSIEDDFLELPDVFLDFGSPLQPRHLLARLWDDYRSGFDI